MSTLWTPDGERPIPRPDRTPPAGSPPAGSPPPGSPPPGSPPPGSVPPGEEPPLTDAELADLQRRLAETPVDAVIANHAYGLFELAALHLSMQPPDLDQARLAIDGFGTLVEGLAGRLGDAEPQLVEGLRQLRLAFVELRNAAP